MYFHVFLEKSTRIIIILNIYNGPFEAIKTLDKSKEKKIKLYYQPITSIVIYNKLCFGNFEVLLQFKC
jgi:hypothetical protein